MSRIENGFRVGHPVIAAMVLLLGCGSETKSDASFESEVVSGMHQLLLTNVQALNQAARDLQAAVPTPVDRGWGGTDQTAIDAMKEAWGRMRSAWEAAEGVLASVVQFQGLDGSLDGRYEDFLAQLGPVGDPDPFDGQGVTGMHAIERILYAPLTPPDVVAQESTLAGSQPAAWPATAGQAAELKTGLCQQLVSDSQLLVDGWRPLATDLPGVFEGLTALMDEQEEKVSLAASHQEESRYAQRTLGDMRDNLAGTRAVYELFVPWLASRRGGVAIDDSVHLAFERLDRTYSHVEGDAIPPPPTGWNSQTPSVADQQTAFGQLFVSVLLEVDPSRVGSAVDAMNHVAQMLGLPLFTGQD